MRKIPRGLNYLAMNRINKKFKELKNKRHKAFIAFITAGDPDLKTTEELVFAFEKIGVDIIELGVPFSDPLADGPTIQASYQRALKNTVSLEKILKIVENIRRRSEIPIALMTSYNPVFHFGDQVFIKKAKEVGIDGVIIPDLPPEEATILIKSARQHDISTIFLMAPTTTPERMKIITQASTGFVYYVSLTGVTGARRELPPDLAKQVSIAKRLTSKPICVGFGISTPAQAAAVAEIADGVIVGSAIVKEIERHAGKKDLVQRVSLFVKKLAS